MPRPSLEKKFRPTLPAATSVAALVFALVLILVASEPATRRHTQSCAAFPANRTVDFPLAI